MKRHWIFAVLCSLSCFLAPTVSAAGESSLEDTISGASLAVGENFDKPVLTIAWPDTLVNPYDALTIYETVSALKQSLRGYRIRTVTFAAAESKEQLGQLKADFVFARSVFPLDAGVTAVRIATRKLNGTIDAKHAVGAAFVVKKDSAYKSIRDLKNKRIFTSLPGAIDGWLAARRFFADEKIDPEKFFSSIHYRNNVFPDVVSAILSDKTDVAVVPACLLETLRDEGLADVSGLRILESEESRTKPMIGCGYSTALYPDISLLALPHAPSETVRDMTIAILSMKNVAQAQWLTNISHNEIDSLMHALQIGPYGYLKDMSPGALYTRHKAAFWLIVAALLYLIFNEFRLDKLVKRRTADLQRAMVEQKRLSAVAAAARMQLAMFERRNVVQQMSGMIAHEINAPVGAIRTWATLARIKCPASSIEDSQAAQALDNALVHIDKEANRIADIVSRVRKYARKEHEKAVYCRLNQIMQSAVKAFRAEEKDDSRVAIVLHVPKDTAWVFGQPLELEILILNLVRNAAAAMAKQSKNTLSMRLNLEKTNSGRWRMTVENPGELLTPDALARLNAKAEGMVSEVLETPSPVQTQESNGLGLGLSICLGIADAHGATLKFEALPEGGVRAVFVIDAVEHEDLENETDRKRDK